MQFEFQGKWIQVYESAVDTLRVESGEDGSYHVYAHPSMDMQTIKTFIATYKTSKEVPDPAAGRLLENTYLLFGKKIGVKLIENSPKEAIFRKDNCLFIYRKKPIKNVEKLIYQFFKEQLRQKIMSILSIWEDKLAIMTGEITLKKMQKSWFIVKEKDLTCNVYCAQLAERQLEFLLVQAILVIKLPNSKVRRQQLIQFFPDYTILADQLNYEYHLH